MSYGPAILAAAAEAVAKLDTITPLSELIARDLLSNKTRVSALKALAAYLPKEIKHSGEIGINFSEMNEEDLKRFVGEKLAPLGLKP